MNTLIENVELQNSYYIEYWNKAKQRICKIEFNSLEAARCWAKANLTNGHNADIMRKVS